MRNKLKLAQQTKRSVTHWERTLPACHNFLRRPDQNKEWTEPGTARWKRALPVRDRGLKLRKEAEAARLAIELQPCQRVADYALKYQVK